MLSRAPKNRKSSSSVFKQGNASYVVLVTFVAYLICILNVGRGVSTTNQLTIQTEEIKTSEDGGGQGEGSSCPLAIRKNLGLFDQDTSRSAVKDEFPNTVMLVSANYAYYNMLQNWEYLAKEHNLKWAVLAMDQRLYDELGPERAIRPMDGFSASGSINFTSPQFKKIACNKFRMMLDVYTNCSVNIVFSDVDNIFFKNPFEHELGRLIRSGRYDYIYQPEHIRGSTPREHPCMREGEPDRSSNTGFYFIRRGNEIFQRLVQSSITRCEEPENKMNDQDLFWREFWKHKKHLENCGAYYHHCGNDDAISKFLEAREPDLSWTWCCMDPYYYPAGQNGIPVNKDPVSYHANWVVGYDAKVKRLREARADGYGWNITRFKDGVGGILDGRTA